MILFEKSCVELEFVFSIFTTRVRKHFGNSGIGPSPGVSGILDTEPSSIRTELGPDSRSGLPGRKSLTLGCGGGNANSVQTNIIIERSTPAPKTCHYNLYHESFFILLRNPLSVPSISLCLRSVCCKRLYVLVSVQRWVSLSEDLQKTPDQIQYLANETHDCPKSSFSFSGGDARSGF